MLYEIACTLLFNWPVLEDVGESFLVFADLYAENSS